jgi:hypothetical protein
MMTNELTVEGRPDPGHGVVLTVGYGPQVMLETSGSTISQRLIEKYNSLVPEAQNRSCAVIVNAETAGTPLVRALFEIYKTVMQGGGKVVVANYPKEDIDSLAVLGLLDLDGFELAADEEDAFKKLGWR